MKSINELTKYFGYFKSNQEFENFLNRNLLNPGKYNDLFIVCKESKIEIAFTNERMIRKGDENKPLIGGKPIFTHFFIYPKSEILFKFLPYKINFSDSLESIEKKAGKPKNVKETDNMLFGKTKLYCYEDDNQRITFVYDLNKKKLNQISIELIEKFIIEESKK